MPEIDENHPYVQFLKKQIKDLDTELEKTKQDRDKWKDESNRWFERYTGSEAFKKLAIVEDENKRLKAASGGECRFEACRPRNPIV